MPRKRYNLLSKCRQNDNYVGSAVAPNFLFYYPDSRWNENNETLIRILHFFLDKIISIIIDCYYNGNLTDS